MGAASYYHFRIGSEWDLSNIGYVYPPASLVIVQCVKQPFQPPLRWHLHSSLSYIHLHHVALIWISNCRLCRPLFSQSEGPSDSSIGLTSMKPQASSFTISEVKNNAWARGSRHFNAKSKLIAWKVFLMWFHADFLPAWYEIDANHFVQSSKAAI